MPTSEKSLLPTGCRRHLVGSSDFSRVGIQAPGMHTSYVFDLLYLEYDSHTDISFNPSKTLQKSARIGQIADCFDS